MSWTSVEAALPGALGITWDECHKIYVLLDSEQVLQSAEYGYKVLLTRLFPDNDAVLAQLHEWFDASCSLRFISAINTVPEGVNPNFGYTDLIAQFELEEAEA